MRSPASFPGFQLLTLVLLPLHLACGSAPSADGSEQVDDSAAHLQGDGVAAFRDVEETLSDAEYERWFALKAELARGFDQICGDTFCEGDFTNLQPLRFRCSLSSRTGQLKTCLWLFAGSYETVTASTGNVRPTAKFFPCKIAMQGTPAALMDVLLAPGSEGALWRPLPGQTQSIYDTLTACL